MTHLITKQHDSGLWGFWNQSLECWVMRDNAPFFETQDKCRAHWNEILHGGFGGQIS